MSPDRDPAIAEGKVDTAEPEGAGAQPGTELEARRELLPELAAPDRAGSIVSEFVSSIVEEAQTRAVEMIQAAAEQNDAGQRDALESADRMRARIDAAAEEFDEAAAALRTESERLAALHERTTAAAITGRPELGRGGAERQELRQGEAAQEPEEPEEPQAVSEEPPDQGAEDQSAEHEGAHDVEVIAHGDDEPKAEATVEEPVDADAEEEHEPAAEPEPQEPEPDQPAAEQLAETERQEPVSEEDELEANQARFAAMSDPELARAYSDALDAMDGAPPESEDGRRLLRFAGSALGEALTRASFADLGGGAPPLERVPRVGQRRRERAEAINTLRRACAQAIQEMASEDALRAT